MANTNKPPKISLLRPFEYKEQVDGYLNQFFWTHLILAIFSSIVYIFLLNDYYILFDSVIIGIVLYFLKTRQSLWPSFLMLIYILLSLIYSLINVLLGITSFPTSTIIVIFLILMNLKLIAGLKEKPTLPSFDYDG